MTKSVLFGILALSLPLFAVACGDEEFASDQMVGDWLIVGHGFVVKFSDDGIYKFAPEQMSRGVPETEFDALVVERGEWVLNDGVLVMVSDEQSLSCQSGARGVAEVSATGNNLVELQQVENDCAWRSGSVKLERLQ